MPEPNASHHAFDLFVERFLNRQHQTHPVAASLLGHHEFDSRLDDVSLSALEQEMEWLETAARELSTIPIRELDVSRQVDHHMLADQMAARRLELETMRVWRRDPCSYNDLAAQSIYGLLTRPHAPLDERAIAIVERLKQLPDFFATACEHLEAELLQRPDPLNSQSSTIQPLRDIPHAYVEAALLEYEGGMRFFEHDVPRVLDNVSDAPLRHKGYEAVAQVVQTYRRMLDWLRSHVLPQTSGTFALGSEIFAAKLRAEEHITTPVAEILEYAFRQLEETQNRMRQLAAAQMFTGERISDLLRRHSEHERLKPGEVLTAYAEELDAAREFILDRRLMTIPQGELRMEEMPPFLRDITIAAIERPGPFETAELPNFFFVTLPDPQADTQEQAELLRAHSRLMRQATIVHEAYPGHYVQGLHWSRTPSLVRRTFRGVTFVEGWAHYCEQMMLDEGFWEGDAQMRLFVEYDALLRIGRVIAATKMHLGQMTVAEAEEFLQRECWQEPVVARMEAHRYTRDPLVLVYSWGKWQLQRLADEYQTKLMRQANVDALSGDSITSFLEEYRLESFHDAVLAHGEPPVELLRRLLLEDLPSKPED